MKYLKPASEGRAAAAQVRGRARRWRCDMTSRLTKSVISSLDTASRLMPAAAKQQQRVELAALGLAVPQKAGGEKRRQPRPRHDHRGEEARRSGSEHGKALKTGARWLEGEVKAMAPAAPLADHGEQRLVGAHARALASPREKHSAQHRRMPRQRKHHGRPESEPGSRSAGEVGNGAAWRQRGTAIGV